MAEFEGLRQLVKSQEELIERQQRELAEKEEELVELRSQLDKYKSVVQVPRSPEIRAAPRKQRACGISAEPQNFRSLKEINETVIKRHFKEQRSVGQSVDHSVNQSVSQSIGRSVSQPVRWSVSQLVSQPARWSVSQLVSQPVRWSVGQSVSQLVSQSVSQLVSQSVNQSTTPLVSRSVSRSVDQSVSQPFSRSVSQSLSQSDGLLGKKCISTRTGQEFYFIHSFHLSILPCRGKNLCIILGGQKWKKLKKVQPPKARSSDCRRQEAP